MFIDNIKYCCVTPGTCYFIGVCNTQYLMLLSHTLVTNDTIYTVLHIICIYSPKNNSLPDIPLTPREREILDKTSDLGIYDNPGMPVSRSADSVTLINGGTNFEFPPVDSSPPPKPPLPQNAGVIVPQ